MTRRQMFSWIQPKGRRFFALLCVAFPLGALTFSYGVVGSLHPITGLLIAVAPLVGVFILIQEFTNRVRSLTGFVHALVAAGEVAVPAELDGEAVDPPALADLVQALTSLSLIQRYRTRAFESRGAALDDLLDKLPDPLIVVDGEREVLRANDAARALFGQRMPARDLAASVRHPEILEAVDAVRAGGTSRVVEFSIPVPVERIYEARIKPFPPALDAAGTPMLRPDAGQGTASVQGRGGSVAESGPGTTHIPTLITLHDITAMKRSERMRADFVGNASHELRTPLTGLIGFIQTLRGAARDDPVAQERFLVIMEEQATRMSRLVDDLLSLSRIEQDEHTPPTGRVDLAAEVQSVVDAFELRAAGRNLRLRLVVEPGIPRVVGDSHQLGQVLQNLIGNAIKYSNENTEVLIRVARTDGAVVGGPTTLPLRRRSAGRVGGRRPGQMVAVSVTDHGEGIERTHLPRLTERFYRVDAARSRALGGTGLGLAIVKHILNRHSGRLTIESELGKGSTFTVYLPLAPEPEQRAEVEPRAGAA